MPIDPSRVTPGVWEVERTFELHGNLRTVSLPARVEKYVNSPDLHFLFGLSFVLLADAADKGYRFTAQYVRSQDEPIECVCPTCRGFQTYDKTCASCGGSGRGLFIPQAKEEDRA